MSEEEGEGGGARTTLGLRGTVSQGGESAGTRGAGGEAVPVLITACNHVSAPFTSYTHGVVNRESRMSQLLLVLGSGWSDS